MKQQKTVAGATAALDAVRGAAASIADERGPWIATLKEVQAVGADLRAELAKAEFAATSQALRGAADRTGEAAAGIAELRNDVASELVVLRQALQAVQRLATMLENDPGALLHGRGTPPRSPLGDK
jgi:NADH dehydrogenase/NADH:ubiquinone oxidoreductase subunit G